MSAVGKTARSIPKVVLGTMEFGRRADAAQSIKMTEIFLQHCTRHQMQKGVEGVKEDEIESLPELDTALMYAGGKTEKIMGNFSGALRSRYAVATKANPWDKAKGGLSSDGVKAQIATSLLSLKAEKNGVDVFYLHAPDHSVDIEETLKAVNELHKAGKFQRFGLSNYASWQVAQIYGICQRNGYVLPSVYQGMYNPITRHIEAELVPCLRAHGMSLYIYNPLAGGVLAGKYRNYEETMKAQPHGRFFGTGAWAETYRDRFLLPQNIDAVNRIEAVLCDVYGAKEGDSQPPFPKVSLISASFRWLLHHSALNSTGDHGDAVIMGASSPQQLEENMESLLGGALDERVVKAFDEACDATRLSCPSYFR